MSYSIYLTNGTLKYTVPDGQVVQNITDLALIGRNSSGYGAYLNDNFVYLLENFANTSQPNHPLTGQLWYDTSENRLKVYNGSSFNVTSGTFLSNIIPSGITSGDLWIDSANGQLWFNDGTATTLAGPIYSRTQGVSGFNVETIIDVNGVSHTALVLYAGGTILGIYSKDSYTPATTIPGFTSTATITAYQTGNNLIVTSVISGTLVVGQTLTGANVIAGTQITNQVSGNAGGIGTYTVSTSNIIGSNIAPITMVAVSDIIKIGFNTSAYPGVVYNGLATEAQSLLAANGSLLTAESFLTTTSSNTTSGTLSIQNNSPLLLGAAGNMQIFIDSNSNTFQMNSETNGQNFGINLRNSGGTLANSIYINANTQQIGIYNSSPQAMLDVAGNVIIEGNLTVKGTTETISSTIVTITDQNITLGATASPTDTTASNGGITLLGNTQKTMNWASTATTSGASSNTGYWNFSDYINVGTSGAGAGYYINGQPLASVNGSSFSLGTNVTSAPGLTSLGILSSLQVSNLSFSGNTIAYNSIQTNGNIKLAPKGNGYIDASGANISSLADPISNQDAATLNFVNVAISKAPLGISLNTTGLTDAQIGTQLLAYIFPQGDHAAGTICRVQASDGHIKLYSLQAGVWTYSQDLV